MSFGPKGNLEKINSINFFMENPKTLDDQYNPTEFELELISEAFPGNEKDIEKMRSNPVLQQQQLSTEDNSESIYNSSSNNSVQSQSVFAKPVQTPEEIKMKEIKAELLEDLEKLNWQESDSKKQLKGYKINTDQKGLVWILGTGIIEGNIQDAIDLFQNIENMNNFKVINSYAKDIYIVKKLNDNLAIRYSESSPPFGKNIYGFYISAKDYDKEKGIHYFYATSTQKPDDCEIKDLHKKKHSQLYYDCFIVQQIEGESNKFKFQYINKMDLCEGIPNWVCNRIRNNRGLEIVKVINEYCQKQEKNKMKQSRK